jgi:hypothetical protein
MEHRFSGSGYRWRYPTEMTETQHDLERLIERSSVDGADGVPISVVRSAFDAVADHPNFADALAAPVCVAVAMMEPKSFFDRSHWPDEIKAMIGQRLHDVDSVILLSFMTSDIERTEHFTGGGVTYDFVIHPRTYSVIHATLGSWRT